MKKLAFLPILLICMAANPSDTFEQLFQLEGLWRMDKPSGPLYEEWKKVNNELMVERSYVLKGKDTVFLEQVQLTKEGDDVFYIPTVKDQNSGQPITFTLLPDRERGYIFENKLHDFPQRVIYRFVNKDSVVARIEGTVKGRDKFSEFYYRRVR